MYIYIKSSEFNKKGILEGDRCLYNDFLLYTLQIQTLVGFERNRETGNAGALHFRSHPSNWQPTTSRAGETYPLFDFSVER